MKVYGHKFRNHKSEEMMCHSCGFVIWRCDSESKAASAVEILSGQEVKHCGSAWHVFVNSDGERI